MYRLHLFYLFIFFFFCHLSKGDNFCWSKLLKESIGSKKRNLFLLEIHVFRREAKMEMAELVLLGPLVQN